MLPYFPIFFYFVFFFFLFVFPRCLRALTRRQTVLWAR